jgi:hypothetical protein
MVSKNIIKEKLDNCIKDVQALFLNVLWKQYGVKDGL